MHNDTGNAGQRHEDRSPVFFGHVKDTTRGMENHDNRASRDRSRTEQLGQRFPHNQAGLLLNYKNIGIKLGDRPRERLSAVLQPKFPAGAYCGL